MSILDMLIDYWCGARLTNDDVECEGRILVKEFMVDGTGHQFGTSWLLKSFLPGDDTLACSELVVSPIVRRSVIQKSQVHGCCLYSRLSRYCTSITHRLSIVLVGMAFESNVGAVPFASLCLLSSN
jgi:hypothetical protein